MAKRIQLVGRLDAAELFERYRAAADRVARSQFQIIWLLASGESLAEVAAASGHSTRWIQKLIHRYNAGGAAALGDPGFELLAVHGDVSFIWRFQRRKNRPGSPSHQGREAGPVDPNP